jgi:peptidyl-prolyl cis-trans isomerase C
MTMTLIRRSGLAVALCLSAALPLSAQDITRDTVVATVNGVDITVGHLIVARDALPPQFQQMPNDQLLPGLIDQLVQQTLLMQSAGDPDARTRLVLENQDRQIRAAQALSIAVDAAVTPEAIEAFYAENVVNTDLGSEYNASHILVETEDEARAIITELDGGATFETLARERSTGPSAPNAGNLGWFGRGDMVPPFEEAVLAMAPGTYTADPVETQFGWHVIYLNETRTREAPPLEAVQGNIVEVLQRQAIEAELVRLQDGALVARPEVTLDPGVLSDLTLLD